MSRLTFLFGEGAEVDVKGMERHYLGQIVENAAWGAAGLTLRAYKPSETIEEKFGPFLPEGWIEQYGRWGSLAEDFMLRVQHDGDEGVPFLSWKGKKIRTWSLLLNTAIVFGSDPVALAAKLHGACELHLRIEAKDRAWLADVIEQGLALHIFRRGYWDTRNPNAFLLSVMKKEVSEEDAKPVFRSMGWQEVADQLRADSWHPVTMEYSVTDGFIQRPEDWAPEGELRAPENDWETLSDIKDEAFGELDWKERFALSYEELSRTTGHPPISPETLRCETFRHELTLLDLMAGDIEKIERALKIKPGE